MDVFKSSLLLVCIVLCFSLCAQDSKTVSKAALEAKITQLKNENEKLRAELNYLVDKSIEYRAGYFVRFESDYKLSFQFIKFFHSLLLENNVVYSIGPFNLPFEAYCVSKMIQQFPLTDFKVIYKDQLVDNFPHTKEPKKSKTMWIVD